MKKLNPVTLLVALAVVLAVGVNTVFTVDEREQALVFQFGEFKALHQESGLKAKVPFIQDVRSFPSVAINVDPPLQEVPLFDKKIIYVDSYAYFRISDPLKFYQTYFTVEQGISFIADRINGNIRNTLQQYVLESLLSNQRVDIIETIRTRVNEEVAENGIELLDVRIRRAELHPDNRDKIYQLMRDERAQEAADRRARGDKQAQIIRSQADKERVSLLSIAERDAQKIRGEADAEAIATYAGAFNQDPAFFDFYRSLEAYRKALATEDTTLVLSPDNQFFKYFDGKR